MRCILVENARGKSRWKRGGWLERVQLEGLELATETPSDTLLVVQEALEKLAAEDAAKAELVKLRFFVGLTHAGAAEVLGVSEPTVKRYWDYARAWLLREIRVIVAEGQGPGRDDGTIRPDAQPKQFAPGDPFFRSDGVTPGEATRCN
jgi:predicted DNA-binding protein (UPF0251 family)